ncbi:MAG: hypothetical protein WA052_03870 [Microgenomates group bacterium]
MIKYPQKVPEAVLGALYGPVFLGFLDEVWSFFNRLKRECVCGQLCFNDALIK